MKKALLILVLASVLAGGVFAQWSKPDLVQSVGIASGYEFYNTKSDSGDSSASAVPLLMYFDITYLTLHAGLSFVTAKDVPKYSIGGNFLGTTDYTRLYVPLGLLLKYPLTFGEKRNIRVFPQAGIEYRLFLSDEYGGRDAYDTLGSLMQIDNYSAQFLDQFSILGGLGGEVDLPTIGGVEGLYIRFNCLADIQIPSKEEKDLDDSTSHFGMKFQLAVGFKVGAANLSGTKAE
ncbi:MAG: hypothetical protein Ta2B_12220 [Termitinemataceae bacterium]|nr:MAG: hypothetical protein Ta2B_12220 [Termitinemataceae bacterium]